MKKRGTGKKNRIEIKAPKVEMTGKRGVSINVCMRDITEEELHNIVEILECENLELRRKYYHSNMLIKKTQQRNFSELLKKFIDVVKAKLESRETLLKMRRL